MKINKKNYGLLKNFKTAKQSHADKFIKLPEQELIEELFKEDEIIEKYTQQNLLRSLKNPNENFLASKLDAAGFVYIRQYQFGRRIFDFYIPRYKVVLEVDDVTHKNKFEEELINDVFLLHCFNMRTLRTMPFDEDRIDFILRTQIKRGRVKNENIQPYTNKQLIWIKQQKYNKSMHRAAVVEMDKLPSIKSYVDKRNSYFEECIKHNFRKDTRK